MDQAFATEPYEVRGSFGGSSRIYNISRRNYHDSTHLGEQLSRYIFKQSVPGEQRQDDNDDNDLNDEVYSEMRKVSSKVSRGARKIFGILE